MKRILTFSLILLLGSAGFSQNKSVDRVFRKYAHRKGVTSVSVPRILLSIGRAFMTDMDAEEKRMLKTIHKLKVLTIEDEALNAKTDFYAEMSQTLKKNNFKEMMTVKSDGQTVKMVAHEKRGRIDRLILVVGGEENVLVSIKGKMKYSDLSKLIQKATSDDDSFI